MLHDERARCANPAGFLVTPDPRPEETDAERFEARWAAEEGASRGNYMELCGPCLPVVLRGKHQHFQVQWVAAWDPKRMRAEMVAEAFAAGSVRPERDPWAWLFDELSKLTA